MYPWTIPTQGDRSNSYHYTGGPDRPPVFILEEL